MKLSCDEATKICDKVQYGEASLWEKIKLNFHLLFCKKCGLYTKQNRIMTACYKVHEGFESNKKHCLNEDEKKLLEKELNAKIKTSIITKNSS